MARGYASAGWVALVSSLGVLGVLRRTITFCQWAGRSSILRCDAFGRMIYRSSELVQALWSPGRSLARASARRCEKKHVLFTLSRTSSIVHSTMGFRKCIICGIWERLLQVVQY